ncbi:hypothetical protein [Thiomicrorhabdus sp. 6S3-12]|uniref:hypothetical protein n=1 Tax=Thiomicrorhabdus sp. 6S3-12 TaxID=2819681 RepID=UPI001AACD056|nr:hypothetical protein [Thiomicrorhabdus sp. 6S3-12]MBO1924963.1 hypothetical protein [Thiomicrorhabdus sp. 6S3-12]
METEVIEEQAAKAVGLILFEFTRLDSNLGLFVVWTNEGQNLKHLTSKFEGKGFSDRLKFIENLAQKKFDIGSVELNKYNNWLKSAHEIRDIRNNLVHGRYGFIPQTGHVANVVGLPTSSEQSETRYTIKELNNIIKRIKELSKRMHELRFEHPI